MLLSLNRNIAICTVNCPGMAHLASRPKLSWPDSPLYRLTVTAISGASKGQKKVPFIANVQLIGLGFSSKWPTSLR